MRTRLAFCLLLLAFAPPVHAATINRIEPGNWWVRMHHNQVELMVHGSAIARTTPRIDRGGVAIVDVQRADNPNYLFVTVNVAADARPRDVGTRRRLAARRHAWRLERRCNQRLY